MDKKELIKKLKELPDRSHAYSSSLSREYKIQYDNDYENGHKLADTFLLEYINDPEVTEIFKNVGKWYS